MRTSAEQNLALGMHGVGPVGIRFCIVAEAARERHHGCRQDWNAEVVHGPDIAEREHIGDPKYSRAAQRIDIRTTYVQRWRSGYDVIGIPAAVGVGVPPAAIQYRH